VHHVLNATDTYTITGAARKQRIIGCSQDRLKNSKKDLYWIAVQ